MSKYSINDTTLTNIADAIRGKEGTTESITVSDFATRISALQSGGGGGTTLQPKVLTGNLASLDYQGQWDDVIELYGDKLSATGVTGFSSAFSSSSIKDLSKFVISFDTAKTMSWMNTFSDAHELQSLPIIRNTVKVSSCYNTFTNCYALKEIPDDTFGSKLDFSSLNANTSTSYMIENMFQNCYNLRSISQNILNNCYCDSSNGSSVGFKNMFTNCYTLAEIDGLSLGGTTNSYYANSNLFFQTFSNCSSLKKLKFIAQNDGIPYERTKWTGIIIDLTSVGRMINTSLNMNNINAYWTDEMKAKRVVDATTYEQYKNEDFWWTTLPEYSRYNHDSAVETINTLPDCSATSGTANTIKFKGDYGSATDGGAINTLTTEEIAVATAKKWTVALS